MSETRKIIRGNHATENARVGAEGQITMDTEWHELRIHDGSRVGGAPLFSGIFRNNTAMAAVGNIPIESINCYVALNGPVGNYALPDAGDAVGLFDAGEFFMIKVTTVGQIITTQGGDSIASANAIAASYVPAAVGVYTFAKLGSNLWALVSSNIL